MVLIAVFCTLGQGWIPAFACDEVCALGTGDCYFSPGSNLACYRPSGTFCYDLACVTAGDPLNPRLTTLGRSGYTLEKLDERLTAVDPTDQAAVKELVAELKRNRVPVRILLGGIEIYDGRGLHRGGGAVAVTACATSISSATLEPIQALPMPDTSAVRQP
jgi:hypothetical protein